MRSLRVRLLVMFMLIVLVAIGAVALFERQTAANAFQNSFEQQNSADQALITRIRTTYDQPGGAGRLQFLVEQAAQTDKMRLIVVDAQNRVLADSSRHLLGQTLTLTTIFALNAPPPFAPQAGSSHTVPAPVKIISTSAGELTFGGQPFAPGPAPQGRFTDALNTSLWESVIVAGLAALVVTLLLSSAILKPIRVLTQAARRMEQGDLSQRVTIHSRDEIGGLAHAFNTMADSLEQAEQLRRNMVSDVAHELRTPLTNIRGYLEALQDQVAEPTPAMISSLYEESLLLSRLITDLQDLSLMEAGQLRLVRVPVSIEDIIARAVIGLALQAERKHIALSFAETRVLPLVEADPERVGQIVRNLLNNAITHTPEGGSITVSAEATDIEVAVQVCDTGVGIAAEHLPYLFKRFYRVDRSRTRATGGTGLGLAIVEQLIHAHGGHIEVKSDVGKGTCFTFTLPRCGVA